VLPVSSQIDKCESDKREKDKCSDYSNFCFHCACLFYTINLISKPEHLGDMSCHKLMKVWCECVGVGMEWMLSSVHFFAPPKKEPKKGGSTAQGNYSVPLTFATSCLFCLSVRTHFRCFVHYCLRPVHRLKETLYLTVNFDIRNSLFDIRNSNTKMSQRLHKPL